MGVDDVTGLAPGVPHDYYRSIAVAEETHWWHEGMLEISRALLGSRLTSGGAALDAGCGTGGFLRFLRDDGAFGSLAGVDFAPAAVTLARERLPDVDLHIAPLRELPFGDRAFELVATNDVLQHVPERDVGASLLELRRVLVTGGALLVRTNGARRLRRERDDWRAYDRAALRADLERSGFRVERLTFANVLLSALAAARGRTPQAPTEDRHGVPRSPGVAANVLGRSTLAVESRWIRRGRSLPYGHTLFALAVRD